jgi:hypothetical protein
MAEIDRRAPLVVVAAGSLGQAFRRLMGQSSPITPLRSPPAAHSASYRSLHALHSSPHLLRHRTLREASSVTRAPSLRRKATPPPLRSGPAGAAPAARVALTASLRVRLRRGGGLSFQLFRSLRRLRSLWSAPCAPSRVIETNRPSNPHHHGGGRCLGCGRASAGAVAPQGSCIRERRIIGLTADGRSGT